MALINCNECNEQISNNAKDNKCPHCGKEISVDDSSGAIILILFLVIVFGIPSGIQYLAENPIVIFQLFGAIILLLLSMIIMVLETLLWKYIFAVHKIFEIILLIFEISAFIISCYLILTGLGLAKDSIFWVSVVGLNLVAFAISSMLIFVRIKSLLK
jgi:hypothetical protein